MSNSNATYAASPLREIFFGFLYEGANENNVEEPMRERIKIKAGLFIQAVKTISRNIGSWIAYMSARTLEVAGTCVMAIPSILATTVKLVVGAVKTVATIIVGGVVYAMLGFMMLVGYTGKAIIESINWLYDLVLNVERRTWGTTKKVSDSHFAVTRLSDHQRKKIAKTGPKMAKTA